MSIHLPHFISSLRDSWHFCTLQPRVIHIESKIKKRERSKFSVFVVFQMKSFLKCKDGSHYCCTNLHCCTLSLFVDIKKNVLEVCHIYELN